MTDRCCSTCARNVPFGCYGWCEMCKQMTYECDDCCKDFSQNECLSLHVCEKCILNRSCFDLQQTDEDLAKYGLKRWMLWQEFNKAKNRHPFFKRNDKFNLAQSYICIPALHMSSNSTPESSQR
jgi:hypothetical protein